MYCLYNYKERYCKIKGEISFMKKRNKFISKFLALCLTLLCFSSYSNIPVRADVDLEDWEMDIEYRKINNNCYWVDDVDSPLYNQWVESSDITWNSAEHLIDYPHAYKYSVVINYNMSPVVSGKGSAIFLHCMAGSYTAGCVAVPESDMLFILKSLDKAKNPVIIIE